MLKFNTKEQIVEALVNEFGEKKSSFYNTDTNKQRDSTTHQQISNVKSFGHLIVLKIFIIRKKDYEFR